MWGSHHFAVDTLLPEWLPAERLCCLRCNAVNMHGKQGSPLLPPHSRAHKPLC